MINKQELKSCPFCGGEAKLRKHYSEHYNSKGKMFFYVQCKRSRCAAHVKPRGNSNKAIEDWNTRA